MTAALMGRDCRYAIGDYRVRHYASETVGGVTVGEHYAVEVMTAHGWRGVAIHPNADSAIRDRDERRRKRLERLGDYDQPEPAA